MEIQYAIFCAYVDFPENTQNDITLTKPVSDLTTESADDVEIQLFLTFIDCTVGTHDLKVEVTDSSGEIITTGDFNFKDTGSMLSLSRCFLIRFPVRKTDLLTFILYLDGMEQKDIKLPIRIERKV